jgi:hypothetical protein
MRNANVSKVSAAECLASVFMVRMIFTVGTAHPYPYQGILLTLQRVAQQRMRIVEYASRSATRLTWELRVPSGHEYTLFINNLYRTANLFR